MYITLHSDPANFTELTMTCLKEEANSYKIRAATIPQSAEIVAGAVGRRTGRKMEDVLGEDQFGLRKGKRTEATGMLRITPGRTFGHRRRIVGFLHRMAEQI